MKSAKTMNVATQTATSAPNWPTSRERPETWYSGPDLASSRVAQCRVSAMCNWCRDFSLPQRYLVKALVAAGGGSSTARIIRTIRATIGASRLPLSDAPRSPVNRGTICAMSVAPDVSVAPPKPDLDGDHERMAHIVLEGMSGDDGDYVPAGPTVVEGIVNGTPVRALCGKVWVPGRDPKKYPLCPTCKEIAEQMGW